MCPCFLARPFFGARLPGLMKRLFLTVLLCLMSLQSSLAVVAEYCGHEPDTAQASHLGHHQHEHQQEHDEAPSPLAQADLDCAHHCFPGVVPSLTMAGVDDFRRHYSPEGPSGFKSAVPDPGKRPPRFFLA